MTQAYMLKRQSQGIGHTLASPRMCRGREAEGLPGSHGPQVRGHAPAASRAADADQGHPPLCPPQKTVCPRRCTLREPYCSRSELCFVGAWPRFSDVSIVGCDDGSADGLLACYILLASWLMLNRLHCKAKVVGQFVSSLCYEALKALGMDGRPRVLPSNAPLFISDAMVRVLTMDKGVVDAFCLAVYICLGLHLNICF